MDIIRPPRLKVGDTIGLIAPSKSAASISEQLWERGITGLENKGFVVVEGKTIREAEGQSIRARIDDLERMFRDNTVHAIMAVCGGMSSNQLLEDLDYAMVARHPKILIGFSDTTALTTALYAKLGLVTFSGPSFLTFCQPDLPAYTEEYFDQILTEASRTVRLKPADRWTDEWKNPYRALRQWQDNPGWEIIRPGQAVGTSFAGNLETLLLLAGTSFWPDLTGAILFVECCGQENPATLSRYFTQLRQMGVYDQITGLVIGRFPSDVQFTTEESLAKILSDATRGHRFPIIANLDYGHTDPLVTIPLGIACRLDTTKQEIVFTEATVV